MKTYVVDTHKNAMARPFNEYYNIHMYVFMEKLEECQYFLVEWSTLFGAMDLSELKGGA